MLYLRGEFWSNQNESNPTGKPIVWFYNFVVIDLHGHYLDTRVKPCQHSGERNFNLLSLRGLWLLWEDLKQPSKGGGEVNRTSCLVSIADVVSALRWMSLLVVVVMVFVRDEVVDWQERVFCLHADALVGRASPTLLAQMLELVSVSPLSWITSFGWIWVIVTNSKWLHK